MLDKNIFGEYKKLDFSNVETLDDLDEILGKIFTNNPNFWAKNKLYYNYGGNDTLECVKDILKDEISIYEYKYKLPKGPSEDNRADMIKFNLFHKWSKGKYTTLAHLYWYADYFLNLNGYSLFDSSNNCKCISVIKNNDEAIKRVMKETDIFKSSSTYSYFRNNIENYIVPDEYISVYIGEIDTVKISNEIHAENNYILVFPYLLGYSIDEFNEGKEVSCYLFEIKNSLINKHRQRMFEILNQASKALNSKLSK